MLIFSPHCPNAGLKFCDNYTVLDFKRLQSSLKSFEIASEGLEKVCYGQMKVPTGELHLVYGIVFVHYNHSLNKDVISGILTDWLTKKKMRVSFPS